jgi:polar amino acid transport system substrate-binding protein
MANFTTIQTTVRRTMAVRSSIAALLALTVVQASDGNAAERESTPAQPSVADGAPEAGPGAAIAGDPQRRVVLRFVTEGDYPPFNYIDAEGALTGFNVDLGRAICLEANAACDVKVRPWDEQFAALNAGEADGAISAHRVTWSALSKVEFSERYFHTPGHFAGKRDGAVLEITPEFIEGKAVAVAKGTAHEAYLKRFFPEGDIKTFETIELAREAMADGKIGYLFDDAIGLSIWVNGTNARQCCELKGGPFLEPKYFGDGIAIALPKSDPQLKSIINAALHKIRESGRFDELVQRYFPARLY